MVSTKMFLAKVFFCWKRFKWECVHPHYYNYRKILREKEGNRNLLALFLGSDRACVYYFILCFGYLFIFLFWMTYIKKVILREPLADVYSAGSVKSFLRGRP